MFPVSRDDSLHGCLRPHFQQACKEVVHHVDLEFECLAVEEVDAAEFVQRIAESAWEPSP
jgi:hypothetical protein